MPRLPRIVLALLVVTILATTAALADPLGRGLPRRSPISASSPSDFAGQLWSFLIRAWTKNGSQAGLDGLPTKNGHQVDPSGGSQPPAHSTTNGDNGHQVDPNG